MPSYPTSAPALATTRATGDAAPATDYNAAAGEINAIGGDLVTARGASASVAARMALLATITEAVNVVAASSTAQTIPAPTTTPNSHITLTANCTLTFPSPAAGVSFTVALKQDATGGRTVTWPGSIIWPGAVTPTVTATAGRTDIFTFLSLLGGSWLGTTAGQNYA